MGKKTSRGRARELGSDDPSSKTELGSRIGEVLDLYDSRKSAAQQAGISVDQLPAYVKGVNAPPFRVIARLADGCGVTLDWIATGKGPKYREARQGGVAEEARALNEAERKLDETEAWLSELEIPIDKETRSSARAAEVFQRVERLATDERLPDRVRERADVQLEIGWEDAAAVARRAGRARAFKYQVKVAQGVLEELVRASGYRPGQQVANALTHSLALGTMTREAGLQVLTALAAESHRAD